MEPLNPSPGEFMEPLNPSPGETVSQIPDTGKSVNTEDLARLQAACKAALELYSSLKAADANPEVKLLEIFQSSLDSLGTTQETLRQILEVASQLSPSKWQTLANRQGLASDITTVAIFVLQQFAEYHKDSATREEAQKALVSTTTNTDKMVQLALALPGAAGGAYSAVKALGFVNNIAPLSFVFSTAGSIAGIVAATVELNKAKEGKSLQKVHIKGLTPPVVDLAKEQESLPGGDTITTVEKLNKKIKTDPKFKRALLQQQQPRMESTPQGVLGALLDKRKAAFEKRLEREELLFDQFMEAAALDLFEKGSVSESESVVALFEEILDRLFAANKSQTESPLQAHIDQLLLAHTNKQPQGSLHTSESLQGLKNDPAFQKALLENLESNPAFKRALLQHRIERKDALSVTAKNQLKSRLLENAKVSQKFFEWKKTKAKINFSAAVIFGIIGLSLATFVIVGLLLPVLPLAIPGMIAFGLTAGLVVYGLAHLKKHKPHLFAETIQGTKIKLAFQKIPQLFHAWRLMTNKALLKDNAVITKLHNAKDPAEKIDLLKKATDEDLPPNLAELKTELQTKNKWKPQEFDKFNKMIDKELEEQKRIKQAVNEHQTKLKFHEDEVLKLQERLETARKMDFENNTSTKLEDFKLIAEALVDGEFWQDEESQTFIKESLGIDVTLFQIDPEVKKALLDIKMKEAILQDSATLLNWLKNKEVL